ncbi:hypothetical protein OY671_009234, partial [Metschnikowia pulcherrima]
QILWNVISPLAKPGIAIGTIFVTTSVMGDFVTVGVMGGQQIASVGKVIQVQMSYSQFPAAAANAVVLLGAVMSMIMSDRPRSPAFYALAAFFCSFAAFSYGPTSTISVSSFQGPPGGSPFPMNGVSTHWFGKLWAGSGIVDIWGASWRSSRLGLVVMSLTVVIAFFAGLAFRKRFRGEGASFTIAVASSIVPSIVVSLGIGSEFR